MKTFKEELIELFEKYKVTIEVEHHESCYDGSDREYMIVSYT